MSYPWPQSSDPNWQWSQQYYQQQQQSYYNVPGATNQNEYYPQQQQLSSTNGSIVDHLQTQTQQRQNLGALAAASMSSVLRGSSAQSGPHSQQHQQYCYQQQPQRQQPPQQQSQNNTEYTPHQRSVVAYDDLSTNTVQQSTFCCNRYYRSAKAIEQHMAQHTQCSKCDFTAIKTVLDEHLAVEHGIGESKKKSKPDGVVPPNAPKIDTPEALAAWIEARKKNWPSKANMERKKQEIEDRKARGQLPSSSNKNNKKRKRDEEKSEPKKEGVLGALGDYGSEDDLDEDEEDKDVQNDKNDDDESVDMERDAVTSKDPSSMGKITLPEKPHRAGPRCRAFMKGSCKFGNKCRYVHEKPQVRRWLE
ncbi:hypothetical protein BDA99DRAFT_499904 [Phascolomyces articulosus]|uniref:C3H1-type domain-containing protein n=1 Tax=Phascolomyces articulosus TaxID=60185 RepID=A0AAD5KK17_9FUNG|nr:hypothetical protein BDA99DRAFT_499904 [Phascolomyces articulosus]